ncbi:MAG: hypothetical protein KDK66_01275 [Deltaproteobacteria bacterium]|nr:hypothetical protein [Deltaproteobacteria bacterium]
MSVTGIPGSIPSVPSVDYMYQGGYGVTGQTGLSPADIQVIREFYEQAKLYQQALQNGTATPPESQEAYTEFLNKMAYAESVLYSQASSNWGDSGTGWGQSGDVGSAIDPSALFGGYLSPDGEVIYDQAPARAGYMGDGRTSRIFLDEFTLDVSRTSASVSISRVVLDDSKPSEENLVIHITNEVTGKVDTYILPADAKVNLKVADPDKVTVPSNLASQVEIGDFVAGDLGGDNGLPQGYTVDQNDPTVANYDGVAGDVFEFRPPLGVSTDIRTHNIYGDTRLSVMNSSKVDLWQNPDGSLKVVVTTIEGEKVTFNLSADSKLYLNAAQSNVTFHGNGGGLTGNIGGMVAGDTPPTPSNELDIPEGLFENVILNGQAVAPEGESGVENEEGPNPGYQEWPDALLNLLDELGIDPATQAVNLSDSLIQTIEDGVWPPSNQLLDALLNSDSQLKELTDKVQNDPASESLRGQLKDRMMDLLGIVYDGISSSGELPENFPIDPRHIIFFNSGGVDAPFEIRVTGGKVRLTSLENEVQAATDTAGVESEEDIMDNPNYEIAVGLMGLFSGSDITIEELLDRLDQAGINLNTLQGFGPGQDGPVPAVIWDLIQENDATMRGLIDNQKNNPSGVNTRALTGHVVKYLSVLYPDYQFNATSESGTNYQNDIRVVAPNGTNYIYQLYPDSWINGNGFTGDFTLEYHH